MADITKRIPKARDLFLLLSGYSLGGLRPSNLDDSREEGDLALGMAEPRLNKSARRHRQGDVGTPLADWQLQPMAFELHESLGERDLAKTAPAAQSRHGHDTSKFPTRGQATSAVSLSPRGSEDPRRKS